jgi:uncharacterized protein YndB with AHSA1/START domain
MKSCAHLLSLAFALTLLPGSSLAQADDRLVHEGVVNAAPAQVWAAFTTREGLESWMTAHAAIDLKVGGSMKTQYDPKRTVSDSTAIQNTILSYEPMRMLSFKVSKAPAAFPFPNAIKHMWTVVYFESEGDTATRVREVSLGFGGDDEGKRMREFFDRGNAYTLQELQKHFASRPGTTR